MLKVFVFPLEGRTIAIKENIEGKIENLCFTPKEETSLFSLLKGKVVEKDKSLEGFWISVNRPKEFFLPFSQTFKGTKVGDLLTLQVVRERVENKPPRVGAFIKLPLCGCNITFRKKGVIGKAGNLLKELKKFSELYGIKIEVWNAERCIFALKNLSGFLEFVKNLPPKAGIFLKWKCFWTILLQNCGGRVYSTEEGLNNFLELFPFVEAKSEIISTYRLLSKGIFSKKLPPLLGEKILFPHGYFLVYENPGLVFVDINGTIGGDELSIYSLESLVRLFKIRQWGGLISVDFPLRKKETAERVKVYLREKLFPLECKVLGFTNGGLLEILCPKRVKTTLEQITERNEYLNCNWFKNDFFLLRVAEVIVSYKGNVSKVLLNPLRKGMEEKLKGLTGFNIPVEFDWKVPPDGFELVT